MFDEIHDPGLQQERTVLAWDRTGLALMVTAGILERSLGRSLLRPISLLAASIFLFGLGLLILSRTRYVVRRARMRQGEGMLSTWHVVAAAVATVLLGIASFLVVLERGIG